MPGTSLQEHRHPASHSERAQSRVNTPRAVAPEHSQRLAIELAGPGFGAGAAHQPLLDHDKGKDVSAGATHVGSDANGGRGMAVGSARDRLLERDAEWARLASEGGAVDEILSYWAYDAIVIPAGMPSVIGKEALRGYVEGSLAIPGFRISWSSSDAEVAGDGTLGFVLSSNEISMDSPDGHPVINRGRAVTVWRRDAHGEWRCAVDIWNAVPD